MPTPHNDHEQPVEEQPVDAIAMLKEDHQRVRDLFAQYAATDNGGTKLGLADQIFRKLEIHAQLEENLLYPTVHEETDAGPALVKESLAAHQTMKQLIQELRGMAHDTEAFDTMFHALILTVEHHVEEEEAEMFLLAEQELTADLDDMKDE